MTDVLHEPLAELLGVLVYAVLALALAVVGAMAELAGARDLLAGATIVGLWKTAAGLIILYAAVSVLRDFVLDRGDAGADDA